MRRAAAALAFGLLVVAPSCHCHGSGATSGPPPGPGATSDRRGPMPYAPCANNAALTRAPDAPLDLRWRAKIPRADVPWSVEVGPREVFARYERTLSAFDASSGAARWSLTVASGYQLAAVGDAVVYDELEEHPDPSSRDGSVIYSGALVGRDAASGKERWRLPVQPHIDALRSAGGRVYFAAGVTRGRGDAHAYAIDVARGAVVWDVALAAPSVSLVLVEGPTVVALGHRQLTGLDAATGARSWSVATDVDDEAGNNVGRRCRNADVSGYEAFSLASTTHIETRTLGTGALRWRVPLAGRPHGHLALYAHARRLIVAFDEIFVTSDPPRPAAGDVGGRLLGVDGVTGALAWQHDLVLERADPSERRSFRDAAFAGDQMAFALDDRLQLVSPCLQRWQTLKLPGGYGSGLTLNGDAFLVTAPGELVRIGLPP